MIQAVADTHALLWYLYADPRLSKTAKTAIDSANQTGDKIGVSSISLIEIAYLAEKGRVSTTAFDRIVALLNLPTGFSKRFRLNSKSPMRCARLTARKCPICLIASSPQRL
jgi:PIN domain nuclease of toxin-antitoxin system